MIERLPLILALVLCQVTGTAVAQPVIPALPPVETEDGLDAGFARAAVLRGEILPLDRILDILRAEFEGEIIEIQLELEDGVLTYEFDLISPDGLLYEVEIDAATGRVLDVEFEDDEDDHDD